MRCEECLASLDKLSSQSCQEVLCEGCEQRLHQNGQRHLRQAVCRCGQPGANWCTSCAAATCRACQYHHAGHILEPLACVSQATVFWDTDTASQDLGCTAAYLTSEFGGRIRAYGQTSALLGLEQLGISVECREHVSAIEAIVNDLATVTGHAVVISAQSSSVKVELLQVQANTPGLTLSVSTTVYPVELVTLTQSANFKLPVRQPLPSVQDPRIRTLLELLRNIAANGQLLHERGWLTRYFAQSTHLAADTAHTLLETCVQQGLLQITERKYAAGKTVVYVSLQLTCGSLEALLWTLRSLRNDEILPTERSIQSRMKEAFGFKPSAAEWQQVLEACSLHVEPSVLSLPLNGLADPQFFVKAYTDPVTGSETKLVYPVGEQWESFDQFDKDVLQVKDTEEWLAFVQYLSGYFFAGTDRVDESKAIPGGRYGCSQLLKACGPPTLRRCSLGKLSYMIQLAINENLFRYSKTLLVWNPPRQLSSPSGQTETRVAKLKAAVLDVLRKNRGGVSLAQLPLLLRKKVSFPIDLVQLGFAKLKDLLVTMPQVRLELRGVNHPFAVLRKMTVVKKPMSNVLTECNGRPVSGESWLNTRLGQSGDWTARCHDKSRRFSEVATAHSSLATEASQQALDEENEERTRRCIEQLLSEDDLSSALQGAFTPHYRSDSIEYHCPASIGGSYTTSSRF